MKVDRTIIVPASFAPLARALCEGLAGSAGGGMFTRELSASGAAPATHYVSSGAIEQEFDALLHDADAMFAACQQAGAAVTLAQCQALVSSSIVADCAAQSPFDTLAAAGLRFVAATP